MEKITELTSTNVVEHNIEKLKELFPTAVSEGKLIVEELQALMGEYIEKDKEYYQMTWAGKTEAQKEANKVSTGTLRPAKDESKDWDTTGNLVIEGDNLEVLKLLQKTYSNKVKMIYIDPPYNTGNDFVYKDNYKDNLSNYLELTGQTDEEGKKLNSNTDSDGRYHSNWLNMMYPRLKLARNLLTDDGVIFISIDDNEQANLKNVCDEIFGEENFVGNFIWRGGRRNAAKLLSTSHEYMICYSKHLQFVLDNNINWKEEKKGLEAIYKVAQDIIKETNGNFLKASELLQNWYKTLKVDDPSLTNKHYRWIDENGVYFASDISRGGGGGPKWKVANPLTGENVSIPERGWAYSKLEDLKEDIRNGIIHFNGTSVPCKKRYLKDNEEQLVETVFYKDRRGSSKRLRRLMEGNIFDFPKDEEVIKSKLKSFGGLNDLVLDFFSGSGTTAHAVMELNAEDGGNRKCISVQLPEPTDEKSEAYKAGYTNIAEITKERIRRAGELIKKEHNDKVGIENLDVGFRVFKLDSSNIKAWDTSVENFEEQLDMFSENNGENIKQDRTEEDVLFEILLKYGLELTVPIIEKQIAGNKVYNIGFGSMYICLEDKVNPEVAKGIGEWHKQEFTDSNPSVIFKDNGFATDADKTNTVQTLKQFGISNVKSI